MAWLLAEDPRLRNAARCSWCQRSWASACGLSSKRSPTPGQSSSSRRIHTQLVSRTPSSIPLVQWMPDRNGFARPPRAELGRNDDRRTGRRREPPRGGEHREVVVAGELPHRLDVARDRLVAVVDAGTPAAVWGAPAGDRVEEPVRVHDVGSRGAEHLPVTGEQPVGGGDEPARGLRRDLRPDARCGRRTNTRG